MTSATMFRSVDIRRTQALWYAWGQIDSGAHSHLSLEDGWTFAEQQAEAQQAFDLEQTHVLPSLLESWRTFSRERRQQQP